MKTGSRLAALALVLGAAGATAAPPADGRWEGTIAIPGGPQPLVIDIEHGADGLAATAILPGRGVKGAPLRELVADADALQASLSAVLPFPSDDPPRLTLRDAGGGRAQGQLAFAGLSAPVTLVRTGQAQVDRPAPNKPVSAELAGRWVGRYELFGSPRQVTLTLAGPRAEMVIVGRRTTTIAFDSVREGRRFVALGGNEYGIGFEGRWREAGGPIEGVFLQGPLELPLTLTRAADGG